MKKRVLLAVLVSMLCIFISSNPVIATEEDCDPCWEWDENANNGNGGCVESCDQSLCCGDACQECCENSQCTGCESCSSYQCVDDDNNCSSPDPYCLNTICVECLNDGHCDSCNECVNNVCVSCKCWDTGDPISGSIDVQDAVICEEVTHTSDIIDLDHWIDGNANEDTPTDSLEYYWSKIPDTNPEAGYWQSSFYGSSVDWQAPPCIGTVEIFLSVYDVPDSMDNPCANSDRDDSYITKSEMSSVSLPDGCSAGEQCLDLALNQVPREPNDCPSDVCGLCQLDLTSVILNLLDVKYNECKWVTQVDATADAPCGGCIGADRYQLKVSDVTENDFCWWLAKMNNNAGCFEIDASPDPNWIISVKAVIEAHETCHFNIMLEGLDAELVDLWDAAEMEYPIDCSDSTTTSCQAVLENYAAIVENAVLYAYAGAYVYAVDMGEAPCEAITNQVLDDFLKSICQRAVDEPWDVDTCQPCVDWGYTDPE